MIIVEDTDGTEYRFPDEEAFATAASSPARPWAGLVQVREIVVVARKRPARARKVMAR